MTNKVIVEVEMLDSKKSLDNLDQKAKQANKTLERTQQLMAGTKGGSKAANAAFQQTEYSTNRGTIGTGAAGRDFAKQSRELGGLVRLYATYAATLYATEAAFRALSQAMDTTNMIEGLNQLGAASGVAMGGLAKRFSEASGGAISLRESMEATAKAVSSGLSQAQFLKLGDVAKKASQALGVNMSDAVSRLTRGITKLEPELLDELGIFTKVGQATEDYARAIGKPASALTDFERRQAFANAVLEEGARKFGQINIETNPYDKLLATLKNVAQAGLEIVNTVLGPFAKLLSNNTGLLVGAVALIGAKIVKDALPAIGQWRTGLKDAADQARKTSSDIAASFGEGFVERTNAAFKVPQLEANLKKSEEAYRASRAKMATMDTDFSKRVLKGGDGTDEKSLKSQQSKLTREINKLKADGLAIDNAQLVSAEKQRAIVVALRNDLKSLKDAKNASLDKAESGGGSMFERMGDWLRASSAKGARDKSARLDILSNVSKNQTEKGFGSAIGTMMKELDTLPGKFNKVRTGIGGIVIAGAGSVGTAISGLSRFLGPVGIGLSILQAALPLFRSNEEAAARFSSSLDLLKENSENAFRVLERLSKLDPLERISIDNIFAKATALEGVGGSLTKAFDDFETELAGRNWADSTVNFLSSIIGRSSEQLLTKQVGNALERAVRLSGSGESARAMQAEIAKTLELPANASMGVIKEALEDASPAIRNTVGKIIEDSGKKAVSASGSFKTFKESLVESGKVYQDLINTTKNSTPLSKFAEDSTKKIVELANSLDQADLVTKLSALTDLSSNINFLQLFPPEAARSILGTSQELSNLSKELAEVESRQTLYNNALADQQKILDKYRNRREGSLTGKETIELDNAKRSVTQLQTLNTELNSTKGNISTKLESASGKFSEAMRDGLVRNIDIFTAGLVDAAARANLQIKKASLAGITSENLKSRLELEMQNEGFELDRLQLKQQGSLIKSQLDLKIAVMENTLALTVANSGAGRKSTETQKQYDDRIEKENKNIANQETTLSVAKDTSKLDLKTIQNRIKFASSSGGPGEAANPTFDATIAGLRLSAEGAQAKASLDSQFKTLAGAQGAANRAGEFTNIDTKLADRLKIQSYGEAALQKEMEDFERKKGTMTESEFQMGKAKLENDKQDFAAQKAQFQADAIDAKAQISAKALPKKSEEILANAKIVTSELIKQAEAQRDTTIQAGAQATNIATTLESFDRIEKLKAAGAKLTADTLAADIDQVNAAQSQLNILRDQAKINDDAYKKESDRLTILALQLDKTKQLTDAEETRRVGLAAIARKEQEAGGPLTDAAKAALGVDREKVNKDADAQVSSIKRVMDARIADAKMIQEQTLRQDSYTEVFKQAFKGMEDAIVQATKTGKLSFKDMINSFGEGLLRFEIQASQRSMFEALGGAGGLGKLLAGGVTAGTNWFTSLFTSAQGSAFDSGIRKFAQGGMFTNSIVASPTLFKFAKGTGMMGEAGPEAIMPLKRDSNGNLGVRSNQQQGNVDVVVNNFGSEKATTKETTDSQGNRKIEIIIGEMVSKEVARTGSSTQQAFSTTFGTRPALARR
jgi:lambda family phage tail tape measure protein